MSDDLDDLRTRVAAARDRLAHDVDFAQKVELRLNDLARIVEGSLARQSAELDGAKSRISFLQDDLERALARAEQATGEASRAERLAKENGELKTMVMALLEVIEGRQKSSLTSVMQQLEENVSALVAAPAEQVVAEPTEPETVLSEPEPEPEVTLDAESEAEPAPAQEPEPEPITEPEADEVEFEIDPIEESVPAEKPAPESSPLEDLSEIALYDAADEVVEPSQK